MNQLHDSSERLARIETVIDHIQGSIDEQKEQVGLIHNKLDIFNSHKIECERTFVKHIDSSYFDRNMKRYEDEKLKKHNILLSIANNFYKFVIAIAGIIVIINNFIQKG
jgi:flagellar motor switch protein FliG